MHKLKYKLESLPTTSGCYLMKDLDGNIIYVGKAKNLRNRVNSYFRGTHNHKTTKLVMNIDDFDFMVTATEKEALLLEINLIKKYTPRYNIMFMDDKTYPYIKLSNYGYPVLKIVRETKKDNKSKYFGPYPDVRGARDTINLLNEIYPLRKCSKIPKKVCLYYHLKQCLGPCEFEVDKVEIDSMIKSVTDFLNGDTREVIKKLSAEMDLYTFNLEFEKAIKIRDLINSINKTTAKQNVDFNNLKNVDAFNYYEDKGYIAIQGLLVRNGKVLENAIYLVPLYGDEKEEFISFIMQYYSKREIPKELILPLELKELLPDNIIDTTITYPHYGVKNELLKMSYLNAKNYHLTNFNIIYKKQQKTNDFNEELSKLLNKDIRHIEIFDNSNTSGTNNVSGMVVFKDGQPSKKDYRLYKLNDQVDDVNSMREVLYRRYYRVLNEELKQCDLIIVDGGKGQIKAAKEVLEGLELDIKVIGLVKDDKHQTRGIMTSDYEEISIDKKSNLFFYLTRIQDEVHRYALTYHQKLRSKAQIASVLDDIKGLGDQRKKLLKSHFKTIKAIKEATIEELGQVVPKDVANNIYEYFKDKK